MASTQLRNDWVDMSIMRIIVSICLLMDSKITFVVLQLNKRKDMYWHSIALRQRGRTYSFMSEPHMSNNPYTSVDIV